MAFWLDGLERWLLAQPETGAFAVVFPGYRPHLSEAIASRFGGGFVDFRQRYMQPLGWDATKLPLSAIADAAHEGLGAGGTLVMQNCEALLSVATAERRRLWFGELLGAAWRGRLIVPLMLYAADWPQPSQRYDVSADELPDESLLERLATLQ